MFDFFKKESLNESDKELLSSNIIGAKTIEDLVKRERAMSLKRWLDLKNNPIEGSFDYEHLKRIHKALFKDVYVWAGFDRYELGYREGLKKGNSEFTNGSLLPEFTKELFDSLEKDNYYKDLSREGFVEKISVFLNNLNIIHPFREGNGRTQRLFLEELAKNAGYYLNLSTIQKGIMISASIKGMSGDISGFKLIIRENLKTTPIKLIPKIKNKNKNKNKNKINNKK